MQEGDGGPKPALRIVSLHADLTDRGPTFDMDLSELERDGQPISYEEARQYFKRDPAHRSAPQGDVTCIEQLMTSCRCVYRALEGCERSRPPGLCKHIACLHHAALQDLDAC